MSQHDFAMFTSVLAGVWALCTWLGWRGIEEPSDVRLMGAAGVTMGILSAVLWLA